MTPSEHRTAVLLDEHPLWLDGVEQVRPASASRSRKATSPEHALALIEEHGPSLFVTSIEMSDGEVDGLECLSRAKQRAPELKVIVLSAYGDPQYVDAAFAAGAEAYVLKTAHADDLASASGRRSTTPIYLARGHNGKGQRLRESIEEALGLTRRELEILTLVAEGHSNAQLARMLWVTEQTVKFHLSNIYRSSTSRIEPRRAGGRRCTGCCRLPAEPRGGLATFAETERGHPLTNRGRPRAPLWERPVNLAEMEAGVYPPEGEAGHFPLGLRPAHAPREGLEGGALRRPRASGRRLRPTGARVRATLPNQSAGGY